MGGVIHCRVPLMPTEQNMHHQEENPTILHPRWPFHVPIQCHCPGPYHQLPKANGQDAILTIMDQGCSRATTFIPCNTTIMGEGVVLLYLKHLFPWFEVLSKVISDRDPCFTSHFAWALTTKLRIGQNISTVSHPQTDGLTECKNQWIEQYLWLYTSARKDYWNAWLPIITFVHNCWPNATIKCSPHEILLGYHPSTAEEPIVTANNETIEAWHQLIKEHMTWWTIGMLMLTNIFTIYIYFSHTLAGVITTSFTQSYLLSNPLQPCPIVCMSL